MTECVNYRLAEITNDCWLRNLADLVKPASDFLYNKLMTDAEDDEKSDLTEFHRVTRKLCEKLEFFKNEHTV